MFADLPIPDMVLRGFVLAVLAMLWIVALTRIVGLRSFSKMTTFDFVMTVATGSLLAGAAQATEWSAFIQALIAMTGLFATQYTIARLRRASSGFADLVQNTPVVLMRDGVIDEAALAQTRVTRADLTAKLREANVSDFGEVRAVVLETTGDLSVLHGQPVTPRILDGTRRA